MATSFRALENSMTMNGNWPTVVFVGIATNDSKMGIQKKTGTSNDKKQKALATVTKRDITSRRSRDALHFEMKRTVNGQLDGQSLGCEGMAKHYCRTIRKNTVGQTESYRTVRIPRCHTTSRQSSSLMCDFSWWTRTLLQPEQAPLQVIVLSLVRFLRHLKPR